MELSAVQWGAECVSLRMGLLTAACTQASGQLATAAALHCSNVSYSLLLGDTAQSLAVRCFIQCNDVKCSAVLYSTVLFSAVQWYTVEPRFVVGIFTTPDLSQPNLVLVVPHTGGTPDCGYSKLWVLHTGGKSILKVYHTRGIPYLGGNPYWEYSILVVLLTGGTQYCGYSILSEPILGVLNTWGTPYWGYSVLVVLHTGGTPDWWSSILVVLNTRGTQYW